jgi:hypothetical protein
MPRFTHESKSVWWVPTITNKAAPTVAQIVAGTPLTGQTGLASFIPVDGVNEGGNRNNASQPMLGSAHTDQEPGTWSSDLEITFTRDTPDTAWDLFAGGYKTIGFIVIRDVGTGQAVAAQKVRVYPVSTHEPIPVQSGENEMVKFVENFAVTSQPAQEAVVAA